MPLKDEKIEIALNLMKELLRLMGMKADVEASLIGEELYLNISSQKEDVLIGKHGRTLEALQFLFNRMMNKQVKEGMRIFIDINQYKERRADSLKEMAARLGKRVKRTSKPIKIGPFNPHDRRIIHLALKEDPSLTTESLGEGQMKKIRIIPTRKAS